MRLYISTAEARELVAGHVPATVAEKAKAKLRPAALIPGQTDIFDHLEDRYGNTARQPEAPAA